MLSALYVFKYCTSTVLFSDILLSLNPLIIVVVSVIIIIINNDTGVVGWCEGAG